jgi:hypothetical protein
MAGQSGDLLDRLADAPLLIYALWVAGLAWTVAGLQGVISRRKRSRIFGTASRGLAFGKVPAYIAIAGGSATLAVLARPYLVDRLQQWSEFL